MNRNIHLYKYLSKSRTKLLVPRNVTDGEERNNVLNALPRGRKRQKSVKI